MRKTFILLIALLTSLVSCKHKEKFQQTDTGIEYKIIRYGHSGIKPQIGGGAQINVQIFWKDSLIFDSKELKSPFIVVIKKSYPGSIDEALQLLEQGDSAIIRLNGYKFLTRTVNMKVPKGMTKEDKLTFYIGVSKVLSPDEVKAKRAKYLKFRRELEPMLIQDYLQRHYDYGFELQPNGLYIAKIKPGEGLRPNFGDSVYINYALYFINGEPVKSTFKTGELFSWRIGDGKVIPGLELAVTQMKEDGIIYVIIPSYLAYGEEGVEDFIPPYSPLVFEIQLVKVVPKESFLVRK